MPMMTECSTCHGPRLIGCKCEKCFPAPVVKLVPRANMPNESAVNLAKKLLAWAESGELQEFAVALIWDNGDSNLGYTIAKSQTKMLGAITRLQMAYFAEHE